MIKKAVRKMDRVVEFIQYDRNNIKEIADWIGKPYKRVELSNAKTIFRLDDKYQDYIEVFVGVAPLVINDYVVKADGHFYIWKPEFFEDKFEVTNQE